MYILVAILVFSVLIFTHELGHFLTAKLFGVRVNEFALFMGPTIFKRKIGETTYSLRCIPIGGFCAMEGEDEDSEDPHAFTSAKTWKRAIILAAGAAMNFITGLLLLVLLLSSSTRFAEPTIESFMEGCQLEAAEDEIYSIDGRRVYVYSDISMLMDRNKTGVFDLEVYRNGRLIKLNDFTMELSPYLALEDGSYQLLEHETAEMLSQQEETEIVYRYGLEFSVTEASFGLILKNAWYTAVDFVRMVLMGLEDLLSGFVRIDDMSGPVGIVSVMAETGKASESTSDALFSIAYLSAFIAINLAVMNMLPIPALDGGRVFFLLITWIVEKIIRRKIPAKYEGYIHAAGMILLLGFIAFVTLKDILKLFNW